MKKNNPPHSEPLRKSAIKHAGIINDVAQEWQATELDCLAENRDVIQPYLTKFVPHGDDWAVIIPDEIISSLGWTEETILDFQIEDGSNVLTPNPPAKS